MIRIVSVGDKLFHWRYGELTVIKLDKNKNKTYVHTKANDIDGIIDNTGDSVLSGSLRREEKVFNIESVGYWVHHDIYGAILENRNNDEPYDRNLVAKGDNQGQTPYAMMFSLKRNLFHRIYDSTFESLEKNKEELKELRGKLKIKGNELRDIPSKYRKIETNFDNLIKEILKLDLEQIVRNYINTNQIAGQEKMYLEQVLKEYHNNKEFYWDRGHELGIDVLKHEYKDDNAYSEFVKASEDLIKKVEIKYDEHKTAIMMTTTGILNGICDLRNSKSFKRAIDKYKSEIDLLNVGSGGVINMHGLKMFIDDLNEDLQKTLEHERGEENKELNLQIKEIEENIKDKENFKNRFLKLEDGKYISPPLQLS